MARRSVATLTALGIACASTPAVAPRADCPAPGPRAAPVPVVTGEGDALRGELVFGRVCVGCHAAEPERRNSDAPANAPRLDCREWLASTSDAYLYDAINRGPGAWGHGTLPPLGERLTPVQIADLVAYLRTLGQRP